MAMCGWHCFQQYYVSFKRCMAFESLIFNIGLPVTFITLYTLLMYEEKIDILQISKWYLIFVCVVLSCQWLPVNFGDYLRIRKNILVYGVFMPFFCLSIYLTRHNYFEGTKEKDEGFTDLSDKVFYYLGIDVTNKCLNGSIRRWYVQIRYGIPKFIYSLVIWIMLHFILYQIIKNCTNSVKRILVTESKQYNTLASLEKEYKESIKLVNTQLVNVPYEAILKTKYIKRDILYPGRYREYFFETSPAYEIQYYRFLGEDVKLECAWELGKRKTSNFKVAERRYTKWTKVGLKNIEYELNVTRHIESLEHYQTDSFSRILIKPEDFGVYYVWYSKIYEDVMHSHLVCKFELKKSEVMTEYIQVTVGSFLKLGNHFFHTFANKSDLTVIYNVQSVALGEINLNTNAISSECSYWTNIYKDYKTNNFTSADNVEGLLVLVRGGTCVSSKLYGIHYLSIVRKLYKETSTNRRYIGEEEVKLRHRYFVVPDRTLIDFLYIEESKQFSESEFPSISDIIDEERIWTIRQGIEFTFILILVISIPKLYNCVYATAFVIFFSKVDTVEVEHFFDFVDYIDFFKEIDCLLISAENERHYNKLISSCLEGENLKVCIPDRDFDVNGPLIKLYSQAISIALSFVIICSTDLLHDPFLNTYVITDMILNRQKDQTFREKNILIIQTESQRLPTSMLELKQVQYFDFSKKFLNETDKKDMILNWARSKSTVKHTFYTIFSQFFKWLERKLLLFFLRHKSIARCLFVIDFCFTAYMTAFVFTYDR